MDEQELVDAELRAMRRAWKLLELRRRWVAAQRRPALLAGWWRRMSVAEKRRR